MGIAHETRLFALQKLVGEILATSGLNGYAEGHIVEAQNTQSPAEEEVLRRKLRQKQFSGYDIFSDPAWDLLLELYVAENGGKRLSISSLGLDTNIAPTTVFRWISLLQNMHLIKRTHDLCDKRRNWISLTTEGSNTMRSLFPS